MVHVQRKSMSGDKELDFDTLQCPRGSLGGRGGSFSGFWSTIITFIETCYFKEPL